MSPEIDIPTTLTTLRNDIAAVAARAGRSPFSVTIVGVAKAQPPERIIQAVNAGLYDIGENYVQELRMKYTALQRLPKRLPIRWHFIGRLQSNKVKYLIPIVHLIHSVDRFSIAQEIDRQAERCGHVVRVLVQVNTSGEDTKGGSAPDTVKEMVGSMLQFQYIRPIGLMTLGGLEHTPEQVRSEFRLLRTLRDEVRQYYGLENFTELSMGMSDDYPIAIEEGATLVRIGTKIFGSRQ